MKKCILTVITLSFLIVSCKKNPVLPSANDYGTGPRTDVPASLQGIWMYGNFSMTEYWSEDPAGYIGNAFEMAIAFKLNANGTYEQYFTSGTVTGTTTTYHQSLSKGTIEMNEPGKSFTTHANTAHYKQTKNGQTTQDRYLERSEITETTNYTYELTTEENGKKTLYIKINGAGTALPFVQQF